jgi:mRNA interferase RelE/StbE
MLYKLRISAETASLVRGLHPVLKQKVRAAFREIIDDPRTGKPLKDELKGLWSFRIKKIRIIYRFTDKKYIDIIAIGPRSRIYQETYRLIKKHK